MSSSRRLINPNVPYMLHGGDYNPDQWVDTPEIWDEDLRLMRLAHINSASIGIFSWASLEPEEGVYKFDWLDRLMDNLEANGQKVVLATPSGGKPNWMAAKYPEIRRINAAGRREPQQARHNHCWTSPVYREKVTAINSLLAERYGQHPALIMWHLSNEYSGYCHCDLCFAEFRLWLEQRYETPEKMTSAFWARFWSHTYTSFDQVTGLDASVHGLDLAWKRFMTDRLISFIGVESAPLRALSPDIPITTNMMGTFSGVNYWKVVEHLDFASNDTYPFWHGEKPDTEVAMEMAFIHDIYRSFKGGQPWILMESTPSQVNWTPLSRPKRPGMHRLASLQAVAHGSDAVMYFQFRKSRGSSEKFHGAVVDHVGHEHTRVFRDVAQVGTDLEKLAAVTGMTTDAEVAIIYDWENEWAIYQAAGPRNVDQNYLETCHAHYKPFWTRGIPVDVIDSVQDFGSYKLLIAPMLYMLRPGVAERLKEFVRGGGTLVATYLTGIADEDDLVFQGGIPGPLRELFGIWVEETDVLTQNDQQSVIPTGDNAIGLPAAAEARHYCDVMHLEGATALATYGADFYAGSPALTVNMFGEGRAFYIGSRNDEAFTDALFKSLITEAGIHRTLDVELPEGVSVQGRSDGETEYLYVMNFTPEPKQVALDGTDFFDALNGENVRKPAVNLEAYGVAVLKTASGA